MAKRLQGKVALVTGGGQGLGKGIAITLARNGADVVVFDMNQETATQVAHAIELLGQRALAVQGSVGNREDVDRIYNAALAEFAHVDIVVNNAGIARDALLVRMTDEQWDAVINVHLTGAFNCTQVAVKTMIERRWGRIINVISAVGLLGNIGSSNYAAAKAAMIGMTKANARELARYGVNVNAIGPAAITPILFTIPEKTRAQLTSRVPLGYMAPPDEVAPAVAFLASEEAKYITGQVLHVEGGLYI